MTLWRDPHGIPHVRGRDVLETARWQGRATAQDRAWQLEIERLRAQAATSDLFADAGAVWDTFARDVDLPGLALRAYDSASSATREFLDAYVEGVRDGLAEVAEQGGVVELGLLGRSLTDVAGEWEPWTPLGVFAVQHVLFSQFPTRLWRRHVERTLGPGAADLLAGVRANVRASLSDPVRGGSNAFAVGGALTRGGGPLVAGDPHRLFEAPGVYQQVGLACPDFDVVGLSFVGVPGVQHFGQTETVAWAVTNAMADAVDVHETLGPDGLPEAFAVHSPAEHLGDLGFDALLPLLHARTVADVDAALEHWVEPVNDVVIADADGRVLHRVAGRMPQRDIDGVWTGWATLPRREVAADEVAVSANERTDASYDVLADTFAPPFRRDRITELLLGQALVVPLGHSEVLAALADVRQNADEALLDVVRAVAPATPAGERLQADLLAWDRAMTPESEAAAAHVQVRDALVAAFVAGPDLARVQDAPVPHAPLLDPWFFLPVRVAAALSDLLAEAAGGRPVLGVDVKAALAQALDEVAALRALEPSPWGQQHRFAPVHAFADFGPDVATLLPAVLPAVAGEPLPGDTESVAATLSVPGAPEVVRGSCARYLFDVADPSASRWAVPLGAHGTAGHPHHADQFAPWRDVTLLPTRPFRLRTVDPDADADLLHSWVSQPWAEFWGMREHTRDEVGQVYAWITAQPHLSARIVEHAGVPLGLVQTYDPFVDEIGDFYDRRPGDVGVHLLLAHDPARAGLTESMTGFMMAEVFADPAVQRIVLEPDVRNEKSHALVRRVGARLGPVVDLHLPHGDKTARFAFLERPLP